MGEEEANIIVLIDFNIDKRDDPRFEAFISRGLWVPPELMDVNTTYGKEAKHYDQIAWFRGESNLPYTSRGGSIDIVDAVLKDLTARQMFFRVSDNFPL